MNCVDGNAGEYLKNFSTSKFLSFKLTVNCFTSWQCTYFCFVVLGLQQRENVQRKSSESFMVSCLSSSSFSIYSCSNHSHHTHHPYHSNNTEESWGRARTFWCRICKLMMAWLKHFETLSILLWIPVSYQSWGPFLEIPGNLTGPKSWFLCLLFHLISKIVCLTPLHSIINVHILPTVFLYISNGTDKMNFLIIRSFFNW